MIREDIWYNSDVTENDKTGRIIAKLHMAFRECENQEEFRNNSLLAEMQGRIRSTFCENDWKYIEENKFEETVEQLALLYDNLPVQLIHRDVHFGNSLFDEGKSDTVEYERNCIRSEGCDILIERSAKSRRTI